nr:copia protein [Tanacetum cinerariifolium]
MFLSPLNIIKNLISFRQFTRDNNCIVEFDAFGFSVKDFLTRHILLRCDSSGDLYPVTQPSLTPHALLFVSLTTWHQSHGHLGEEVLRSLVPRQFISCNRDKSPHVCHAWQLGKHVRLPFSSSDSIVSRSFEIVHSDIWTSPIQSLYGLKHASRAWLQRFASYALHVGFTSSRCNSSLFIYQHGTEVAYLLIYVDDIVLTASSTTLLQHIISSLHKEFDMTNLRALNYFLGISVTRYTRGTFLSQKKYAMALLKHTHVSNCNATRTSVDTQSKLGSDGDPVSDPTLYCNISYAVQQICLYMHDHREPHLAALKRVLRYVRGTLDFWLQLYAFSTSSLVTYSHADWVGCPTTRRSTSGYCVFFGNILLSWSSKRQHTLSHSNAKVEYRGVANVVAEIAWLRNLLRELHTIVVCYIYLS